MTANSMAANHVTNGGTNFLLPKAIWMATANARVGRAKSTRQIPKAKVNGPLAGWVDALVLDASTIAKIFDGTITRWDDPAPTALDASMPAEEIRVIYRSDASGTTDNFQPYLQAASGGVGTGAAGNNTTAALVKSTEGAIGYNELSFALRQGLYAADIKTPASRRSLRPVRIDTDTLGNTITGAVDAINSVEAPNPE